MNAIKSMSMLMGGVLALVMAGGMLPAAQAAETVEYIHTDALGSPVAVTDANGAVIERTVYEPYGAVVGGPVKDGPGYTGHVSDSATALSYMQQRYMDPKLGTFLSVDPVGTSPVDGLNFGRYRYASSNPYTNRDPDGRCDGPSTCAIDRDIDALNSGKMPMDEFRSRSEARGAGALIGAGAVVTGRLAIALTPVAAKFAAKLGGPPKINEAQQKNLARFEKKFSRENRKVEVKMDRDGNATFKNEVPGRVPGSKAVYEKTVDASGKTTAAGKTTYDPKGEIVHIMDKL